MNGTKKNFQEIVKNVHTFDGKYTADFIVWHEKIRISLNIYLRCKAIFRVLLGESQLPAATAGDNNAVNRRAVWDTAIEDLYSALFFTTKGEACSVVRRFSGKTLNDGSEHRQRAWAALRKTFDGCSREALKREHASIRSVRMISCQDPDEFLYELDTRREHLNTCDSPECPTDRQYEVLILQTLAPEYERVRTFHLEKLTLESPTPVVCCLPPTRPTFPARARQKGYREAGSPYLRWRMTTATSSATIASVQATSRKNALSALSTSNSETNGSSGMYR